MANRVYLPIFLSILVAGATHSAHANEQPKSSGPLVESGDELPAEDAPRRTLLKWISSAEEEGGPPPLDEPLASDRPDFTEASSTVGRGIRQLEMGWTLFRDEDPGTRLDTHSLPEFLLRMGIFADWLELRVGWTFFSERDRIALSTVNGSDDLYLGIKLGLTPQQGIWPEMALVPQMRVPLGGPFSALEIRPGFNWLYGWDISEFLSFAGSTQANLSIDDATGFEFVEVAQSLTIGYSFCDRLGAYTEWFVLAPAGASTVGTEHYVDGGFIFRLSSDLQLDIRAGKGVSGTSVDFFGGIGAVVRF